MYSYKSEHEFFCCECGCVWVGWLHCLLVLSFFLFVHRKWDMNIRKGKTRNNNNTHKQTSVALDWNNSTNGARWISMVLYVVILNQRWSEHANWRRKKICRYYSVYRIVSYRITYYNNSTNNNSNSSEIHGGQEDKHRLVRTNKRAYEWPTKTEIWICVYNAWIKRESE